MRWTRRGPLRQLVPLLAVVAVVLPLRSAVADWNDVPSGSMRPTILEGDRIYVDKLAYGLRLPFTHRWLARWEEPDRGDVITLASPQDGVRLVKRVVGLPGDRIAMRSGRLYVNGAAVPLEPEMRAAVERLADGRTVPAVIATESLSGREHEVTLTPSLAAGDQSTWVVPEDRYFFLGDNRQLSADSRRVGTVHRDAIYGQVRAVALSFDPEHLLRPRFERWFTALD